MKPSGLRLWKGALLASLLGACNPFGPDGSGGNICTTASPPIDTYKFAYSWKQINGYDPPRSDTDLQTNYNILIIEPGQRMCSTVISQGAEVGANYKALYTLNVDAATVSIQFDVNNLPQPTGTPVVANYSFTGSCSDTQMELTFPPNSAPSGSLQTQTYVLWGTNVAQGTCDPQ